MNAASPQDYTPELVLNYWFNQAEHDLEQLHAQGKIWYSFSADRDEEIKKEFGALLHDIGSGKRQDWSETSSGVLASVIVLDQFSRQIFRKKPDAFAYDEQAIAITYSGISRGLDQEMSIPGRLFFYHPFQHSEKLKDQEFGVQIVRNLRSQCDEYWHEYVGESLRYFEEHYEIVRRFGRFPHRNEVLDRRSTSEELEFLRTASRYGQ